MSYRSSKLAAVLFVLCCAILWKPAAAGTEAACCQFTQQCASMTDAQILDAALNKKFGACYYHTRCSTCACDYYVKVSYYTANGAGYDGGTGCMFSLSQVASTLRKLCADGICCCPQKIPTAYCADQIVWAKNPVTGACCEYSRPCIVPDGWAQFATQTACETP